LTEAEIKAFRLADNRISESEWDEDLLEVEFEELNELDIDLEPVGFDDGEISSFLEDEKEAEEDEFEEPDEIDSRCEKGQVWKLGEHRLMCGDATSSEDFEELMEGKSADMVFTDPPYNVNYDQSRQRQTDQEPKKNKLGTIENDEMTLEEFREFLRTSLVHERIKKGAPYYVCMGSKYLHILRDVMDNQDFHWSNYIIWYKNNFALMRSGYQRQYEPVYYGWRGTKLKDIEDRSQTDVWEIDIPTGNGGSGHEYDHPTQKPVKLPSRAVKNSSEVGDLVVDMFGGSGSTLIACEQLDRVCFVMELDPDYCEVIMSRWEELTGDEAVLVES